MGFISNHNPIMGNDPNDLPRKIEVDAEGNLKTSLVSSLAKDGTTKNLSFETDLQHR